MAPIRLCVASLLRRRFLGTLAVALLIGVAGASVMAAFAGARRTESAFPRLLDWTNSLDVLVSPDFGEIVPAKDLRSIPSVSFATDAYGFSISTWNGRGERPDGYPLTLNAIGVSSSATAIEEPLVLEGRLPRPNRADELFINEAAAKSFGLRVGDRHRYTLFNYAELLNDDGTINPDAEFTPVTLVVVGLGRSVDDLLINENQDAESVVLTPAFTRQYRDRASFQVAGVFLKHGERDLSAFTADLNDRLSGERVALQSRGTRERAFEDVSDPYTAALSLFGIAAGFAALVVIAQALVRMVDVDAGDSRTLAALGAVRGTRAGIASGRAWVALALGTVIAAVGAVALSPLFPLGRARQAEPDPGVRVDTQILGLGVVAIVVLLAIPLLVSAWRQARTGDSEPGVELERSSTVAKWLGGTGAPPTLVSGVRFAFRDPSGRRASLFTTVFGLGVALATVIAALVFATSLNKMITVPERYGWTWDAITDTYDGGATPELVAAMQDDDRAEGLTIGVRGNVALAGAPFVGYGFTQVRGEATPRASEGRMPRRVDEVALGAETMRRVGKDVGDDVEVTLANGEPTRLHIVGRTALPSLALNGTDGLGDGAALTTEGLARLDATASPSFFLIDLAPGVTIAQINADYRDFSATLGAQRPGAIRTYEDVRRTPLLLAGFLALLGAGVLVHLLVTSVRARRRDLAVMKTIGFTRRQIALTVAVQATTLVACALVVGVPLGLVLGRATWSRFADNIGVSAGVVVPGLTVVAVTVVAVVIGNLAAAVPARTAARTQAGVVLRAE